MAEVKAGAGSAPKTSINTEVVIGKAAQNLTKAVAELNSAFAIVKTMEGTTEDLSLKIANQESKISELELSFKETERQMSLDLELKMKANSEETVIAYLKKTGRQVISTTDFQAMEKTIKDAKESFEKEKNAAVASALATEKLKTDAETKLLIANHKTEEAANTAKISTLEAQVKFHEQQSNIWKQQLDAERDASIQRAKAGAIGNINVGDPGTRR